MRSLHPLAGLALAALLAACGGGGSADVAPSGSTTPPLSPAPTAIAVAAPSSPVVAAASLAPTAPTVLVAAVSSAEPAAVAPVIASTAVHPSSTVAEAAPAAAINASTATSAADRPATRAEAARFLAQATFGPTEADIEAVMQLGYAAWIDRQFAIPARSHRAAWEAADAALKTRGSAATQAEVIDGFWTQAITGPDQLRQRVVFALSQIFVISMVDGNVGDQPRAVAAWLDLLGDQGLGRYRDLLEGVARHPLMGAYLSHLRNQKADARTGRVPDENFAREVMQLFSIGLVQLDESGRSSGVPTYGAADIAGLARVFTGFSWACPAWPEDLCFLRGSSGKHLSDADRWFKPMVGYPKFHSTEEKRFLSAVIPPQAQANPEASLKVALDTLAAHPNVGPFIGRQLIQRLVTSNPSDEYVAAVSRAFADNGSGVRGDMKAVIKAVLLHPEARQLSDRSGKVREPVLRLSALLRAYPFRSESGAWRVGNTDSPINAIGQTVLRSPSVFNFWRPGYKAPGSRSAAAGLVAPELQASHETATAGYVNYLREVLTGGIGPIGAASGKRDVQADFSAEMALADRAELLVDRALERLVTGPVPAALRSEIVAAVSSIAVPAPTAKAANQRAVDDARRARVNTALLLVLASPEFQVQR